jgi:cytochrome P450
MEKEEESSSSSSSSPSGLRSRSTRSNSNKEMDILAHLMVRDDENGTRLLDYSALHGNVRMLLFAGHDTTAVTVAWALWELAAHPEIQKKLQAEIDMLFDARNNYSPTPPPSFTQISQLKYLDAVMRETLRMHAPAIIARTPTEDIHLDRGNATYTIPAGASIFVMPKYTQIQAAYVKEPATFRPERFQEEEEEESMRTYMPF